VGVQLRWESIRFASTRPRSKGCILITSVFDPFSNSGILPARDAGREHEVALRLSKESRR
jgi:hypothetical protein